MAPTTLTLQDPNGAKVIVNVKDKRAGSILVIEAEIVNINGREHLSFTPVASEAPDGKRIQLAAPFPPTPSPDFLIPLGPYPPTPSPDVLAVPFGALPP